MIKDNKKFNKYFRILASEEGEFVIRAQKKTELRNYTIKWKNKYPVFSVDILQTNAFEELKNKIIKHGVPENFTLLFPETEQSIRSYDNLRAIPIRGKNPPVLEIIVEQKISEKTEIFQNNCINAVACCEAAYASDPVKFLKETFLEHCITKVTQRSFDCKAEFKDTEEREHYVNAIPSFIIAGTLYTMYQIFCQHSVTLINHFQFVTLAYQLSI